MAFAEAGLSERFVLPPVCQAAESRLLEMLTQRLADGLTLEPKEFRVANPDTGNVSNVVGIVKGPNNGNPTLFILSKPFVGFLAILKDGLRAETQMDFRIKPLALTNSDAVAIRPIMAKPELTSGYFKHHLVKSPDVARVMETEGYLPTIAYAMKKLGVAINLRDLVDIANDYQNWFDAQMWLRENGFVNLEKSKVNLV